MPSKNDLFEEQDNLDRDAILEHEDTHLVHSVNFNLCEEEHWKAGHTKSRITAYTLYDFSAVVPMMNELIGNYLDGAYETKVDSVYVNIIWHKVGYNGMETELTQSVYTRYRDIVQLVEKLINISWQREK